MESNSHWDKLKKNNTFIDKNYNGLIISLNKKNLNNYDFFHSIFYVDISNFNQTIKELKNLTKEDLFPPQKKLTLWQKIKILLSGN
jgi:hypothetical protein